VWAKFKSMAEGAKLRVVAALLGVKQESREDQSELSDKTRAAALGASLMTGPALAVDWNFYHHQSRRWFAPRAARSSSANKLRRHQWRTESAPCICRAPADRAEQHHGGGCR